MANTSASSGHAGSHSANLGMAREASLAVFCDFENIALGVRDAKYAKFDIQKVLERLLVKGLSLIHI